MSQCTSHYVACVADIVNLIDVKLSMVPIYIIPIEINLLILCPSVSYLCTAINIRNTSFSANQFEK